ncbi:MAG: glutamate synthase subunit beta [Candidatus Aceula meridiana]|nr:glutamate synthase subunit beta [Candidatus Aceula meridiana]
MGQIKGFLEYNREEFHRQSVEDRLKHWKEFYEVPGEELLRRQGARCMDCGIPFCQWGCPIGNIIPDWNDLVYQNRWQEAIERLQKTNNFPEFTGRLCPAPCENSCTLGITDPAVTIKNIEVSIIEKAYSKGWITPRPPKRRTGKKVAVVGSGPSGLACADQLNKKGHQVVVFEKNEVIGGLLALGIPDFKLEKRVIIRRVEIMEKEGVQFKIKTNVGIDMATDELLKKFDAVVLAGGSEKPRDLDVPGRELSGVHFAMDFLTQQNRVNRGETINDEARIDVKGQRVIVLGGGDTGADCVGTANRQGAASVKQLELLPELPKERAQDNPWPHWAFIKRTSTSQEEGVEQHYGILTKNLSGKNGKLTKLHGVRLEFGEKDSKTGRSPMKEVPKSEFTLEADRIFLAMGFVSPVKKGLLEGLGVGLDERGNVKTADYMTSIKGVFAAGDMRRGQSLVVWAIHEGRNAAQEVHGYLNK